MIVHLFELPPKNSRPRTNAPGLFAFWAWCAGVVHLSRIWSGKSQAQFKIINQTQPIDSWLKERD
jgi:hypothetical protein